VINATPGADTITAYASNNHYAAHYFGGGTTGQSFGFAVNAGTNSTDYAFLVGNQAQNIPFMTLYGDGHFTLGYNGSGVTMLGSAAGNITINAPSSGVTFTVHGVAGTDTAEFYAPNTASNSNGLYIQAGTNGSDYGLWVANAAGSKQFVIFGSGNVTIAAPSSGVPLTIGTPTNTFGVQVNGNATGWAGISLVASGQTYNTTDFEIYQSATNALITNYGSGTLVIGSNGGIGITIAATNAVRMNHYGAGTATFDASGNITSVSDERAKRNIRPFVRGLADILKLKPILHGYTLESGLDHTKDDYAGFSAQNVQSIMPEAVGCSADGMLSLSDRAILAAVVNAVQELAARVSYS